MYAQAIPAANKAKADVVYRQYVIKADIYSSGDEQKPGQKPELRNSFVNGGGKPHNFLHYLVGRGLEILPPFPTAQGNDVHKNCCYLGSLAQKWDLSHIVRQVTRPDSEIYPRPGVNYESASIPVVRLFHRFDKRELCT